MDYYYYFIFLNLHLQTSVIGSSQCIKTVSKLKIIQSDQNHVL